MKDGKPAYIYNFLGLEQFTVESEQANHAPATKKNTPVARKGAGVFLACPSIQDARHQTGR